MQLSININSNLALSCTVQPQ